MGSLLQKIQRRKVFRLATLYAVASWILLGFTLTLPSVLFSQQAFAADTEPPPPFGMVVSGKRPGPPLWKVTNQDNVLWIFGTLRYLPKRLRWDPVSVRFILSESDEYISPPRINSRELNPLKAYGLMRKIKKLQKNPDGQTLQDVLPAELYALFLEAKSIYAPRDKEILELRPAAASNRLFNAAREIAGLAFDQKVDNKLRSIARGRGATVTNYDKLIAVDTFLVGYENIRLEDEIACMESTLETIRTDLDATVERANAWANGDARLLLNLDYPDTEKVCGVSLFKSDEVKGVIEQTRLDWVASIENALSNNKLTVANFPMREIVHPEGLLAQLRQQGYVISGQ